MKTTFLLSLLLSFVVCLQLTAQEQTLQLSTENTSVIPSKISYQGVLTDNAGVPQNGTFTMTFGLYTTPTGGSPLWSETQNTVQVTNGIFNVLLGSNTPINVAFDVPYYLAVSVQGTALLPRIELASSGYSFNTARIQGRSVSSSSPSSGQVLKWTGSEWAPGTDETGSGGGGTVTQVNTGSGLTGGPITTSGTISIASSGVTSDHLASNSVTASKVSFPFSKTTSTSNQAFLVTNSNTSFGEAIRGEHGSNNWGILGTGNNGVTAVTWSNNAQASLYAFNGGSAPYAGSFSGNVTISGSLSKGGGSFEIDHPLDPENMILRHSFVESPDMLNVYNGNITTDASGIATIQLPDYFEALNRDFRYQLTVVGQFAQAIILDEIQNNQFTIQTDRPNVKVSWQVTGIRKDPWAEKNRIVVEERKTPVTRGFYLYPELYGLPKTRSLDWAKYPDFMKNVIYTAQQESGKE